MDLRLDDPNPRIRDLAYLLLLEELLGSERVEPGLPDAGRAPPKGTTVEPIELLRGRGRGKSQ